MVVVLGKSDELIRRGPSERVAMAKLTILGILSLIDNALGEGFFQIRNAFKILIVAIALTRQSYVQAVVEVFVPKGLQAASPFRTGADEAAVVEVAFGDEVDFSVLEFGELLYGGAELL